MDTTRTRRAQRPDPARLQLDHAADLQPPFELLANAFSLGEFELIHYRLDANKLSPLLSAGDLRRFVVGMIAAVGPLSLSQLSR